MTEFKKGDRVVFTKDDAWWERGERVRMPKGTLGTYLGTRAWREAAPWVRLDTGEDVLAWADAIAPAEDHGTGDGSASDICAEPGCNCDLERRFPAPEPEPEWKPGTVYAAASADGPVRLYRNKGIDRDYWLDAGGEMVPDEAVSKVRPLVVIDPAEAWHNLDVHLAGTGDLTQAEADLLGNVFPEVDLGLA